MKSYKIFLFIFISSMVALSQSQAVLYNPEGKIHENFVDIKDIDSNIQIKIKYHSKYNILGKRLAGINANKALMTRECAIGLKQVQSELRSRGYNLVIYNAYMPLKAYKDLEHHIMNNDINTDYLSSYGEEGRLDLAFLHEKRDNIRGGSVDVSIVPITAELRSAPVVRRKLSYGYNAVVYIDDGSVDLGSSYDIFSEHSSHQNPRIGQDALGKRAMLKKIMEDYGFRASGSSWWHYTCIKEPFKDTEFNFDVK